MAETNPGAGAPAAQPPHDAIAVDLDNDNDSAFGDDVFSDTTSLSSAIYRGSIENGRKYQTLREGKYWGPSDEIQFDTMDIGHVLYQVLDSDSPNPLIRSPIGDSPQNILDLGTGPGTWAIDVADKYPSAIVKGIDLYPPPSKWVPPNCTFEVDDITQEWTWESNFDLIHMRLLLGALTPPEFDHLYAQIFTHLKPGGYIEQLELDVCVKSDDNTLSQSSLLASWGDNFLGCANRSGRPIDNQATMRASIEKAGFVDVHEKLYKAPIGGWAKDPLLKEAGRINKKHWTSGLEGWAMFLLTKYGEPEPWEAEKVREYVEAVKEEIADPKVHSYHFLRRVWAKKPEA